MNLVTNVPHYDTLIKLVSEKAKEVTHEGLSLFVEISVFTNTEESVYNFLNFTSKFKATTMVTPETREYLESFCGRHAIVQEDVLPNINKIAVFYCDEEKQIDIVHSVDFLDAVANSIIDYIFNLKK